jgi:hypothetical protein
MIATAGRLATASAVLPPAATAAGSGPLQCLAASSRI